MKNDTAHRLAVITLRDLEVKLRKAGLDFLELSDKQLAAMTTQDVDSICDRYVKLLRTPNE